MTRLSALIALSLLTSVLSDMINYNGRNAINMEAEEDNWSLKFAVGQVCPQSIWTKTITIDVKALNVENDQQADLVLAFGTYRRYFAAVIAYDGAVWVMDPENDGKHTRNSALIGDALFCPPDGYAFMDQGINVDDIYEWENKKTGGRNYIKSWRESLVPNEDKAEYWDVLYPTGSKGGDNTSPLVITVENDDARRRTVVTYKKGGESKSITYRDNFQTKKNLFLWLSPDNLHEESFKVRSIKAKDSVTCDFTKQEMKEYDGKSVVQMEAEGDNWSLKFPVGQVCANSIWTKTITMDIVALTGAGPGGEADLVLALGTNRRYVAATIAYDGQVWIQDPENDGTHTRDSVWEADAFFSPPRYTEFMQQSQVVDNLYHLESQKSGGRNYLQTWRESLVPNQEKDQYWRSLFSKSSGAGANTSPLVIKVRNNGRENTIVTYEKNGESKAITYRDTFTMADSLFLWLAPDTLHQEIFQINSITVTDTANCNIECPENTEQIGGLGAEINVASRTFSISLEKCADKCLQFSWCKSFGYSADSEQCKLFRKAKADSTCAENQILCTRPCATSRAQSEFGQMDQYQDYDFENPADFAAETATATTITSLFALNLQQLMYVVVFLMAVNVIFMVVSCFYGKKKTEYAVVSMESDIEK